MSKILLRLGDELHQQVKDKALTLSLSVNNYLIRLIETDLGVLGKDQQTFSLPSDFKESILEEIKESLFPQLKEELLREILNQTNNIDKDIPAVLPSENPCGKSTIMEVFGVDTQETVENNIKNDSTIAITSAKIEDSIDDSIADSELTIISTKAEDTVDNITDDSELNIIPIKTEDTIDNITDDSIEKVSITMQKVEDSNNTINTDTNNARTLTLPHKYLFPNELAKRLGIHKNALTAQWRKLSDEDFAIFTKSLDPESKPWYRVGNRYSTLEVIQELVA